LTGPGADLPTPPRGPIAGRAAPGFLAGYAARVARGSRTVAGISARLPNPLKFRGPDPARTRRGQLFSPFRRNPLDSSPLSTDPALLRRGGVRGSLRLLPHLD
jgi:hypothetical protein